MDYFRKRRFAKKIDQMSRFKRNPKAITFVIEPPVVNKNMAPAVRTYLTSHNLDGKKVGFFCTAGGSGMEKHLRR